MITPRIWPNNDGGWSNRGRWKTHAIHLCDIGFILLIDKCDVKICVCLTSQYRKRAIHHEQHRWSEGSVICFHRYHCSSNLVNAICLDIHGSIPQKRLVTKQIIIHGKSYNVTIYSRNCAMMHIFLSLWLCPPNLIRYFKKQNIHVKHT